MNIHKCVAVSFLFFFPVYTVSTLICCCLGYDSFFSLAFSFEKLLYYVSVCMMRNLCWDSALDSGACRRELYVKVFFV